MNKEFWENFRREGIVKDADIDNLERDMLLLGGLSHSLRLEIDNYLRFEFEQLVGFIPSSCDSIRSSIIRLSQLLMGFPLISLETDSTRLENNLIEIVHRLEQLPKLVENYKEQLNLLYDDFDYTLGQYTSTESENLLGVFRKIKNESNEFFKRYGEVKVKHLPSLLGRKGAIMKKEELLKKFHQDNLVKTSNFEDFKNIVLLLEKSAWLLKYQIKDLETEVLSVFKELTADYLLIKDQIYWTHELLLGLLRFSVTDEATTEELEEAEDQLKWLSTSVKEQLVYTHMFITYMGDYFCENPCLAEPLKYFKEKSDEFLEKSSRLV